MCLADMPLTYSPEATGLPLRVIVLPEGADGTEQFWYDRGLCYRHLYLHFEAAKT